MTAKNIPLHCTICPKRPNFSDVSHLLTHIASKGHLSNYYKVKVRSTHEEASRKQIDAYDRWYAEWSVEELMSERMTQKDKRRTRTRPATRSTPTPKIESMATRSRRHAAIGNPLDPRLVDQQQQYIKLEPSATPSSPPLLLGSVFRHRTSFAPHMQYWSAGSRTSSLSYTNPDRETSSEYSEYSERRKYQYTAMDSCAVVDDLAEDTDPMAVNESTKLKGVYWPGMDIFDSATPEMRRKRNQKKDSSVVEQLELNSLEVEATELVFTPQGSFKRLRRMSCSDSEEENDIGIKLESPRPLRRRAALATLSVNAQHHHRSNALPAFSYMPHTGYDDNISQHTRNSARNGNTQKRKPSSFTVYQDEVQNACFSQPNGFTYLNSGFLPQLSPSPGPAFVPYKRMQDTLLLENKENVFACYQPATQSGFHDLRSATYNHPVTAIGHGHQPYAFQYNDTSGSGNTDIHHTNEDVDDEGTLTAPPSPSIC